MCWEKVSDVAAEGTVRGFYVDGSRDGDYEDGAGRMQVKWYSYSGIESQVSQGDWVVVEGILMQSDASSPYTSGYYIRPSSSAGIQLITQDTVLRLSEAVRQKKDGTAALAGLSVTVHGVAAGPTGQWHESNTAFAMVSPRQTPGLDPVYPSGGLYVYGEGIAAARGSGRGVDSDRRVGKRGLRWQRVAHTVNTYSHCVRTTGFERKIYLHRLESRAITGAGIDAPSKSREE